MDFLWVHMEMPAARRSCPDEPELTALQRPQAVSLESSVSSSPQTYTGYFDREILVLKENLLTFF